jgi:hypothetical protein
MTEPRLDQLTEAFQRLWKLTAPKSPPRGPHQLLPAPAEDALLAHLAMGLHATRRALEIPRPPDAPAHLARALEELNAAVALLQEWVDAESG